MFDFSEDPRIIAYLAKLSKGDGQAQIDSASRRMESEEADNSSGSDGTDDEMAGEVAAESSQSASPNRRQKLGNLENGSKPSGGTSPRLAAADTKRISAKAIEMASTNNEASSQPSSSSQTANNKSAWLENVNAKYGEEILAAIVETTHTRLDDVEGNGAAKAALEESVVLPALNPTLFTGLRAPCKGILLFGPPGNGKTMLAKAVANECQSTFFNISAATIMSKWVGDGERLVKALFQVARNAQPSIIFIDEVDSMLCQRFEQEDGAARRVKTEFLVQLDGCSSAGKSDYRVLVLAATNRPQELDEGILRRFPQRVFIDLPDQNGRANMIKRTFELHRTKIELTDVELGKIAAQTCNYSYSDLMALCRAAALIPIQSVRKEELRHFSPDQLRPVNVADLDCAARTIRPSTNAESRQKLLDFAADHAQLT